MQRVHRRPAQLWDRDGGRNQQFPAERQCGSGEMDATREAARRHRCFGDIAVTPVSATQVSFQPSAAGNFRLIAYVDLNGNGMWDEGEQLQVLQIAIVQATLQQPINQAPFFQTRNTLAASGASAIVTTSASQPAFPMAIYGVYLLEGGGAGRTVGAPNISIGEVGNLLSDTFTISYPGTTLGIGVEAPGGDTPMVDAGPNNYPYRTNSVPIPSTSVPAPPATGGRMVGVISGDSPTFGWRLAYPHPRRRLWQRVGQHQWQQHFSGVFRGYVE